MCKMDNEVKTKVCTKCGRELPLDAFSKKSDAKDGLQYCCKECQKEAGKNRSRRRNKEFNLYDFVCNASEAKLNPELAKFTPRQLQEELSARGFHGQLEFVMKAKL